MHKQGIEGFEYYVGVNSLADLATKEDRCIVLNITGNESRGVTPTSHEYSGGNIVFGTSPGRTGQKLKTKIGDIPVYNSVKEGMAAGHKFNTAVIYLPPSGVKDGVAECVRANPDLKKVIVLTEKVSAQDSRIIRAICQTNGVDCFGANCLGLADAWNQVRLGGALGGNNPEESLVKGSVAIFSNSGNFTTTMAVYLQSEGWGTTVSVSSGKDVYIHYGPHEFYHAVDNDDRTKCVVIYSEPGGYYEHGLTINKPTVACVVGRWKAKLTKACGHAGSLAGSGDDAAAKEKWFMEYFDVDDIFTPENPVVSKKGAVVINIAHIPLAMTKVMELNNTKPDFEPKGDLDLKCWFKNDQGIKMPDSISFDIVDALEPYDTQIEELNKQVGAQFPRQSLKDASGASQMDPKSQVSKINGISILESSKHSLEDNLVMSITKGYPTEYGKSLANAAFIGYTCHHGYAALDAAEAARKGGTSPNIVLSSALGILGKGKLQNSINTCERLLELFQGSGLKTGEEDFDYKAILSEVTAEDKTLFSEGCGSVDKLLAAVEALKGKSVFIDFIKEATGGKPSKAALLSAIWATIGWKPLMEKKISKYTFSVLPWHSRVYSTMVGCSTAKDNHGEGTFCNEKVEDLLSSWSFTEVSYLALLGKKPDAKELFEFSMLMGLIITNGPGTISAQGSKGAVSADGPETPSRVQVNKGYIGFLTHTGFAHGGNGYEAIAFLVERFKDTGLKDASDKKHGIDLKKIADDYAKWYVGYKNEQKAVGNIDYAKVPCVNHPVFKGKDVNYDPRERFVKELFEEKGIYNVFLDFYGHLVQALFDNKASKNVYCVNIDAVIAVILLKAIWQDYNAGKLSDEDIENSGFTAFLYGRMIGCGAEIDDHSNRGKNMDTRTAASKVTFV